MNVSKALVNIVLSIIILVLVFFVNLFIFSPILILSIQHELYKNQGKIALYQLEEVKPHYLYVPCQHLLRRDGESLGDLYCFGFIFSHPGPLNSGHRGIKGCCRGGWSKPSCKVSVLFPQIYIFQKLKLFISTTTT